MIGVIQVSVEVTQLMVNYDSIDLMLGLLRNSTGMTSRSPSSLWMLVELEHPLAYFVL